MAHTTPTLMPLGALTPAQESAVAFLARYTNRSTHELYRRYLGEWFAWCESQVGAPGEPLDPLAVRRTHVELYVRHLQLDRGLAPGSVGSAMSPIRGFYGLALSDGLIDRDPTRFVRLPKIQHATVEPFDRDDMRRFLRAAASLSPRHHALAVLLCMLALRISEACILNVEDAYRTEQGFRVIRFNGKGGKPAAMPLPYQAIAALEAAAGNRPPAVPLLTTLDGRRLTRHAGAGLVQTVAKRAGFTRHLHPHLMRKAAVTLVIESGGTLTEAQDLARHADPRTTQEVYNLSRGAYATHASHLLGARLAG